MENVDLKQFEGKYVAFVIGEYYFAMLVKNVGINVFFSFSHFYGSGYKSKPNEFVVSTDMEVCIDNSQLEIEIITKDEYLKRYFKTCEDFSSECI